MTCVYSCTAIIIAVDVTSIFVEHYSSNIHSSFLTTRFFYKRKYNACVYQHCFSGGGEDFLGERRDAVVVVDRCVMSKYTACGIYVCRVRKGDWVRIVSPLTIRRWWASTHYGCHFGYIYKRKHCFNTDSTPPRPDKNKNNKRIHT